MDVERWMAETTPRSMSFSPSSNQLSSDWELADEWYSEQEESTPTAPSRSQRESQQRVPTQRLSTFEKQAPLEPHLVVSHLKQRIKYLERELKAQKALHKKPRQKMAQEFLHWVQQAQVKEDQIRTVQREALTVLQTLKKERQSIFDKPLRGVIVTPTGSGKTLTALLAMTALRPSTLPIVFLCRYIHPVTNMNEQMLDAMQLFKQVLRHTSSMFDVDDFFAEKLIISSEHRSRRQGPRWYFQSEAPTIIFGAMRTFVERFKRARNHCRDRSSLINPSLIIIDESHLEQKHLSEIFTLFPDADVICFTATPDLSRYKFPYPILYEMTDKQSICRGSIVNRQTNKNPIWLQIDLDFHDLRSGQTHVSPEAVKREISGNREFRQTLLKQPCVQEIIVEAVVKTFKHFRQHVQKNAVALHKCESKQIAYQYKQLFSKYLGTGVYCATSDDPIKAGALATRLKHDTNLKVLIIVKRLHVSFHDPRICIVSVCHETNMTDLPQAAGRASSRTLTCPTWFALITPSLCRMDDAWSFWKAKAHFGYQRAIDVVSHRQPELFTDKEQIIMGNFCEMSQETNSKRFTNATLKVSCVSGRMVVQDHLVNDERLGPKRQFQQFLDTTTLGTKPATPEPAVSLSKDQPSHLHTRKRYAERVSVESFEREMNATEATDWEPPNRRRKFMVHA
ncbi:hypothetical protein DFJ77DRAFT_479846 [Powellomyces hirtus]|nr:hypothetical protein DFJ77DRAFT_479846 [Powellomyces hirtus]